MCWLFLFVVISAKISTMANFETGVRPASGGKKLHEHWLYHMNIVHIGACSIDHEVFLFFTFCVKLDSYFFQKVSCRE